MYAFKRSLAEIWYGQTNIQTNRQVCLGSLFGSFVLEKARNYGYIRKHSEERTSYHGSEILALKIRCEYIAVLHSRNSYCNETVLL